MEIIVNTIALGSDLAADKLEKTWAENEDMFIYHEDDSTSYSDKAQEIFDEYFDEFMTIIERNRFEGQIRK